MFQAPGHSPGAFYCWFAYNSKIMCVKIPRPDKTLYNHVKDYGIQKTHSH